MRGLYIGSRKPFPKLDVMFPEVVDELGSIWMVRGYIRTTLVVIQYRFSK